jgi:hypothetical protein
MFLVFNLSENNNHANKSSLGHKLDFQIHIKGAAGGSVSNTYNIPRKIVATRNIIPFINIRVD